MSIEHMFASAGWLTRVDDCSAAVTEIDREVDYYESCHAGVDQVRRAAPKPA